MVMSDVTSYGMCILRDVKHHHSHDKIDQAPPLLSFFFARTLGEPGEWGYVHAIIMYYIHTNVYTIDWWPSYRQW